MNIYNQTPVINCPNSKFTGGIYKNNNYYFTKSNNNKMFVYDDDLKPQTNVELCNSYVSITPTASPNLFYASKSNDNNIYKLNDKFEEYDKIPLNLPKGVGGNIVSISYDTPNNKIMIANNNRLYSVTPNGDYIKDELTPASFNAISENTTQTSLYQNLNGCCHYRTSAKAVPNLTAVGNIDGNNYIAYNQNGVAYTSLLSPQGNIMDKNHIGENLSVNSFINKGPKTSLLVTKNSDYSYIYDTYEEDSSSNENCQNEILCLEDNMCNVNEDLYIEDNNCDCLNNEEIYKMIDNCCNDNNDIIESIALIENAIACVLNIESKKIEKILEVTDDTCEIIKVNDSVSKVITKIIMLEQILYNKLEVSINKNNC